MSAALASVVALIGQHPGLAYVAVLLLAMSESLPVIGVLVPGTAAILAISTLVPSGAVSLWPLVAAATGGAILGDGLSYQLGRHHHAAMLSIWPLRRYPAVVVKSQEFLARHGNKSVFLARFMPGVRAFVPMMAGVLHMPPARFYVANVSSALIWAPTHILPGVLVGASVGAAGHAAGPLAALLVTLALLLWASRRLVLALHRYALPQLLRSTGALHARLAGTDGTVAKAVATLLDPSRASARTLVLLGMALLGSSWLFLGILEDVVSGDPLITLDVTIYDALDGLRSAPGDALMIGITELGDPVVVVAVTLAVGAWLLREGARRTASYWLAAIGGATVLNAAIKFTLHRARPVEPMYAGADAFSFPSGHSTVNLVLWGFLGLLLIARLDGVRRALVTGTVLSLVVAIAFSRLYLGAHWFSDVAGGLAFGSAWLLLIRIDYVRGQFERVRPGPLALVASLAFVVAGGAHVLHARTGDATVYARAAPSPSTMTEVAWRRDDWRTLPAVRTGTTGEIEEPFSVQVAALPLAAESALTAAGWQRPLAWSPSTAFAWFDRHALADALPVLPALAGGRWPDVVLVRAVDSEPAARLVLRLWRSDRELATSPAVPVLLGSIVEERIEHIAWWVPWLRTIDDSRGIRAALVLLPAELEALPALLTGSLR